MLEVKPFFYPNECFICKVKSPLKRCDRCNMISYCHPNHKKMHLWDHTKICQVIFDMCRERNVLHIYEGFQGVDLAEWRRVKKETCIEVQIRLGRPLAQNERQMFEFPRSCFVCHDSRQDLLESCHRCTNASFCTNHFRKSTIHSIDCPQFRICRQLEVVCQKKAYMPFFKRYVQLVVERTNNEVDEFESWKSPLSMSEYMEYFGESTRSPTRVPLEEIFCVPLTVYNALYKLENSHSEIVLHVNYTDFESDGINRWEVLLHLMPRLKSLKIIIFGTENHAKLECRLCEICLAKKKTLSLETIGMHYAAYADSSKFENPDLLVIMNKIPAENDEMHQRVWKLFLMSWGVVDCPIVITSVTKEKAESIKRSLNSTFKKISIYYDGYNNFPSPRFHRQWEDERLYRENHMMIICRIVHSKERLTCSRCGRHNRTVNSKTNTCAYCESELLCTDLALFPKTTKNRFRNYFFATSCRVCHREQLKDVLPLKPCQSCRMIFYCHERHRKEDLEEHRELCRVISKMQEKYESCTLFEKVDKSDENTWQISRYKLLFEAQVMLGRNMVNYEREMFLFPKTCFKCYESNLEVLKDCKCGLSFCEAHIDCTEHKEDCRFYRLMLLAHNELMPIRCAFTPIVAAELVVFSSRLTTVKTVPLKREVERLSRSMTDFIETYIPNPEQISTLQKMLYAEMFSRPLTLLYVMRKLKWSFDSTELVVHVIGTDDDNLNDEKSATGYWEIVLHLEPNLKKLKVFYIGPEISELEPTNVRVCENCCNNLDKSLEVRAIRLTYNDYFRISGYFIKPDIVVGFNFHLHEENFGIKMNYELSTICALKDVKAPFVMTAGTQTKARLTFLLFKLYLGESLHYDFLELNPFSGLTPERDFEYNDLKYSNHYIAAYTEIDKLPTILKVCVNCALKESKGCDDLI